MDPVVKRTRVVVLSGALAVCVAWLALDSVERRVDARVLALRERLSGPALRSEPERFGVLHARVRAVDAYLEQKTGRRESFGAPWTWGPEHRPELARDLASLGSFFEQVDSLLDDAQTRWVLAHEGYSPDTPRHGSSRHRTNVLCAQALVDFDRADGSRDGAKRLGEALDLIRLEDDGRTMGYLISAAEEDIVLEALRRVLQEGRADPCEIREELGARLDRISRPDRVEIALSGEIDGALVYFDARGTRSAAYPWARLESCIARSRLADGAEECMRRARAVGERSRERQKSEDESALALYVDAWLNMADYSHVYLARCDLARRAVDLAIELKGAEGVHSAPPIDRFSGSPIHEETTDRGVEIRSDGALAALQRKPGEPGSELLCWSIPR
jgi:hypothetical protein